MPRPPESSSYIEENKRRYSLYVLQHRAIPAITDGLKPSGHRVLWMARNGQKVKTATLAGSAMSIHPHAMPDTAINTLTAPFGNNIPLFDGNGVFGTKLNPTAYGASRYTSVKISEFTKDVVFRDIEIIPMQPNYDETEMEPVHFLPLVPICLLNQQEGIAVGFASDILPRELDAIVGSQIKYLTDELLYEELPAFTPTNQWAQGWIDNPDGTINKYIFHGFAKKLNTTTVNISGIPYGMTNKRFEAILDKMVESGEIIDIVDNSKDNYDVTVKFKRGVITNLDGEDLLKKIGLIITVSENLNLIDFDGERVIKPSYGELIAMFCEWRVQFYVQRFERLKELLEINIQKYKDIILAVNKNIGGVAKKIKSKDELREYLEALGIVHIEYIADLPVYRFTTEEKEKVQEKLNEALKTLKYYNSMLKSPTKRRDLYVEELKEIQHNWKRTQKYRNEFN